MTSNHAVPILMYHQVTPVPHPVFRKYSVKPGAFAAQMAWLAWAGYEVITLDTVLRARAGQSRLPRRPVVITFDDGFQDCWEHAAPVLRGHGFSAIFFLVASFLGRRSTWLVPEIGVEFSLMDWSAARELVAAGLECGAHTMTHPRLASLSAEACRDELRSSRLLLEERLGCPIHHLAYPFGSYDERVKTLAKESGYHSACSVQMGLSTADDDRFALRRVPVLGTDSIADFIIRLRTAQTAGHFARRFVHAARRQLVGVRGWS
jgi:peptidoglycan/xylan/chitin deacetylase (PgdA/CDA1 family)